MAAMEEEKISELSDADLPLTGTELVEIVQSGTSKKVAVSDVGGTATLQEDILYADLVTKINAGTLSKGVLYKITDKGDRGLFFTAISTNQLAKDGTRLMLCPARYSANETVGGNVWKGVWNSIKNPDVDDLMIHGGKVWKNLTGNIGTATSDILLDAVNWVVIPKESFSNNEYAELKFGVQYDIYNDWIERQWDAKGNIFGLDFISFNWWDGTAGYNYCNMSDWNFDANADGFVMFDNITMGVWNNSNAGSIFSNKNPYGIYGNRNTGDINNNANVGYIEDNSNAGPIGYNNNRGSIQDNSNAGQICYNGNGDIIINNSNAGAIDNNSNGTVISDNTNGGNISYNKTAEFINSNSNTGNISNNSNSGKIYDIGSANANIIYNNNNGNIHVTTTGDITDTIVNK